MHALHVTDTNVSTIAVDSVRDIIYWSVAKKIHRATVGDSIGKSISVSSNGNGHGGGNGSTDSIFYESNGKFS